MEMNLELASCNSILT